MKTKNNTLGLWLFAVYILIAVIFYLAFTSDFWLSLLESIRFGIVPIGLML